MFFWNSLTFSMIQWMLAIWSLVPLPFLNPAWTSGSSHTVEAWLGEFWALLPSVWDECNFAVVWAFFGIAFLRDWTSKCTKAVMQDAWCKELPVTLPTTHQASWEDRDGLHLFVPNVKGPWSVSKAPPFCGQADRSQRGGGGGGRWSEAGEGGRQSREETWPGETSGHDRSLQSHRLDVIWNLPGPRLPALIHKRLPFL